MGLGIIARPLLAALFVQGGINQVRQPGGRVRAVQSFLDSIPADLGENGAENLVKANGAIMAGAGTALALGIAPKLAACALVASLVPTTIVGHPLWTMRDNPKAFNMNLLQVLKNAAIAGGLIQVMAQRRKPKAEKSAHQPG
jgi:uncharacterized membrane protein YphA (DoxX/SURF4 family)